MSPANASGQHCQPRPTHAALTVAVSVLPDGDQLGIECQPQTNNWRMVLRGELDIATAPALTDELARLQRDRPDRVVLDLRETSFMDCAGLHSIVAADLHARRTGSVLEVVYGPGQIERILNLTGFDRQLTISAQPAATDARRNIVGNTVRNVIRQHPFWSRIESRQRRRP